MNIGIIFGKLLIVVGGLIFIVVIVGNVYVSIMFFIDVNVFDVLIDIILIEDFEVFLLKNWFLLFFVSNGNIYIGYIGVWYFNVWVFFFGYINYGVFIIISSIIIVIGDEDFIVEFGIFMEVVGFDIYFNIYGLVIVNVFGVNNFFDIFVLN